MYILNHDESTCKPFALTRLNMCELYVWEHVSAGRLQFISHKSYKMFMMTGVCASQTAKAFL